jgi:DNA-binding SARP family transcriptional activator/tetratricopeptide (TPR) repeat protein/TolB-like protein
MIELRTFGTLDLRAGNEGKRIQSLLARPKRIGLLAYLILARPRGLQRRDALFAVFWPEASIDQARAALNQALYVLRRVLGDEAIETSGKDEVGVNLSLVACDAVAFDEAVAAGRHEDALRLYQGELLAGFHLSESAEFERWLDDERGRLRSGAIDAAKALAARERDDGNPAGATHWLRRAISFAPYDERLIRELTGSLAAVGDLTGAVREYEAFASRLNRDLELDPSTETKEFIARLRSGNGGRATNGNGAPSTAVSHDESVGAVNPSLPIAKQAEMKPSSSAKPRRWPRSAIAAAIVLAAVSIPAGTQLTRILMESNTLVANRIIVVPFENETGDSSLAMVGRMAADWITQALDRSGLAEVVPATEVAIARRRFAQRPTSARPSARELARDMRAGLLVSGRYYRHASGVTFQALIVDTKEGTVTRTVDVVADTVWSIEETVDRLRQRTVGALATVFDPRMADWSRSASQPPSFEAYRLYATALDLRDDGGNRDRRSEAASLLLRAAAADSNFTVPLIWAIRVFIGLGEVAKADSVARTLAPKRDHLAPWDRAMFDYYVASMHGRHLAAYQAMQRVAGLAPGSQWMLQYSFAAMTIGRGREAIAILRSEDGRRNITSPQYWNQLLTARHLLGDYTGELDEVARMREFIPDGGKDAEIAAWSALGRVEPALAVAESLLATTPNTFQNAFRVNQMASELWAHGHREESRRLYGQVVDWVKRSPAWERGERAARMLAAFAMVRAGREAEAQPLLELLAPDPEAGWAVIGHLGIQAARAGRHGEAEERLQWLLRREGEFDTGEPTMWAAAVAAHMGQLERAVEIYQVALSKGFYQHVRPIHTYEILEPLRAYAPFRELTRLR